MELYFPAVPRTYVYRREEGIVMDSGVWCATVYIQWSGYRFRRGKIWNGRNAHCNAAGRRRIPAAESFVGEVFRLPGQPAPSFCDRVRTASRPLPTLCILIELEPRRLCPRVDVFTPENFSEYKNTKGLPLLFRCFVAEYTFVTFTVNYSRTEYKRDEKLITFFRYN